MASLVPVNVLPWTDIVHSCIFCQLATLDYVDIICYKDEPMAKYYLSSEGLGWGGDHLMDSLQDVVNTTVSEARTMVEQGAKIFDHVRDVSMKLGVNQIF